MAYGLKYTTYKQHPNGDRITLNIYQNGWTGASYGIAALTGFSLEVQGEQSEIYAPIVKTSVGISLKDFFDRGTAQADGTQCVLNGEKWGRWEEFYTYDPVKYRVDVVYSGGLTRNSVIWSGSITPDSWGEDMSYGGDIRLTARDMLGYLDEQEFDLTGRVTVQSLISTAITRSKGNMAVSFKTSECLYNGNGNSILAATIDAAAFAGQTWYQALEKCLDSLGLVLRYDGNGGMYVTSIRHLASHTMETHTPRFTGRSGYRSLDPAIKQIVETFGPEVVDFEPADPKAAQFVPTGTDMTQVITAHLAGGGEVTSTNYISKYTMSRPAGTAYYGGDLAVPALGTPSEGAADRGIYFPTDITTGEKATYTNAGLKAPFLVNFAVDGGLVELAGTAESPILRPMVSSFHYAEKVVAHFLCSVGGTQYGLRKDGTWTSGSGQDIEIKIGDDYEVPKCENGSGYIVRIDKVVTYNTFTVSHSVFAPLIVSVKPSGSNDLAGEYKTTTIYNEDYHNEITRDPSIGAATTSVVSIINATNILAYGNDIAADEWKFSGDASTYPLAVMIHAQLLVYHASENGNSVFTGSFNDATRTPSVPGTRYTYYQRSCILISGAYDFLTGDVGDATLREVMAWGDVWDPFDPEWTRKTSRKSGGTSSASGGGSSSGGGGGTSVSWGDASGAVQPLKVGGDSRDLIRKQSGASGLLKADGTVDRTSYQTEITSDNKLSYSLISGTPSSLKNPYALTFGSKTYDGSAAKTVTASDLGAITAHQTVALASGTNNGTLKITVGSTVTDNIAVKGLGSAAYKNESGTWAIGISGNAGTATKLATARSIWGQSFDGSGNVSGALSGATTGEFSGAVTADSVKINGSISGRAYPVLIDSTAETNMYISVNNVTGFVIDSENKVVRRGVTTAAAAFTLGSSYYPWGGLYSTIGAFSSDLTVGGHITLGTNQKKLNVTINDTDIAAISTTASALMFGRGTSSAGVDSYFYGNNLFFKYGNNVGTVLALTSGGNVGVGLNNTTPDAKLHILAESGDTYPVVIRRKSSAHHSLGYIRWETDHGTYPKVGAFGMYGSSSLKEFRWSVFSQDSSQTNTAIAHLSLTGNFSCNGQVTAGTASDIRFKEHIEGLKDADSILASLRPVEFDWNELATSLCEANSGHDTGLIAQEVEEVLPQAVSPIYGDYKRVDYAKLTPVLVSGWQSHETQIQALRRENEELKERIANLERMIDKLMK